MKSMIRWPGFGLFAALVLLITAFFYFFADGLIKRVIENLGSSLVGARVELTKADLTLFPAGLELTRLQVTNPDAPKRNAVEIDRVAMSIDPLRLLQRKIIIEEMTAVGVRPDTARKTSGALPGGVVAKKEAKKDKAGKDFKIPSLELPDIKEVLAREDLRSLTLAREYQEGIKDDKAKWEQRLAELPSQRKLEGYRERLDKIGSSSGLAGILGGASELVAVRQEVQADLNRLKSAQVEFTAASSAYKKRLAEIQDAPRQDIRRLMDKYSLSPEGLANLGSLLFGARIGDMLTQALAWYKKAQPLLERNKEKKEKSEVVKPVRGRGVMVRFEEEQPLPDFLIRRINASVLIAAGAFAGTIDNVTPDQDILGAPLTFVFSGEELKSLRSVKFDGVLDHVNPTQVRDAVNLGLNGYALENTVLSSSESLPVTVTSGQADLTVRAVVQQRRINGAAQGQLKSASFTTSASQDINAVSQAIFEALSSLSTASIKAEVTGTIDDYNLRISSDLDNLLKQAAGNVVKSQTAKFEQRLKEAVMEKAQGPLAEAAASYGDFGAIAEELSARLQTGGKLL